MGTNCDSTKSKIEKDVLRDGSHKCLQGEQCGFLEFLNIAQIVSYEHTHILTCCYLEDAIEQHRNILNPASSLNRLDSQINYNGLFLDPLVVANADDAWYRQ